ncbi:MAG: TetR/AcrR family transcriptional regulator [bacterium]|nr:TetR/AcrR family transcriptional regulator [bacterium]
MKSKSQAAADAPSTRDAILEAARARFARFGPRKTTMDEVARAAGCSRTTLYSHFRNMEDVYGSVLEQGAERFIGDATAAVNDAVGAGAKIRAMIETTRANYAKNDVLRMALTRDADMSLESAAHVYTRGQERQIIELLGQILEDGVREGSLREIDPERVAYLMFHLGTVLVEREVSGVGDYEFNEIMEVMDDVFARGIAAPERKRH